MDSRIFIKSATALRADIKNFVATGCYPDDQMSAGPTLQKEIHALFSGLQNPTLPSAKKLRDEATAAGFVVNPQVSQKISQAQQLWMN